MAGGSGWTIRRKCIEQSTDAFLRQNGYSAKCAPERARLLSGSRRNTSWTASWPRSFTPKAATGNVPGPQSFIEEALTRKIPKRWITGFSSVPLSRKPPIDLLVDKKSRFNNYHLDGLQLGKNVFGSTGVDWDYAVLVGSSDRQLRPRRHWSVMPDASPQFGGCQLLPMYFSASDTVPFVNPQLHAGYLTSP
jgi:hypothetical protein